MRGRPAPKAALVAERLRLTLDVLPLLLPFHAERRIGEYVVEGSFLALVVAIETVPGECVAKDDVIRVLALDKHVSLADGPRFVVPVLTEQVRVGLAIEIADVFLSDREHTAGTAGWIVDGFDDMALAQVIFRVEQEVYHQPNDFARSEVLSSLLVGLFCTDPDELLENVTHLDVVNVFGREVHSREFLDHLIEQVLLRHAHDLLVEGESLHDLANVFRVVIDVGVEVRCKLVRVVQQFG